MEVRTGDGQVEVRAGDGQVEVRAGDGQVEVRAGDGQVEVRRCVMNRPERLYFCFRRSFLLRLKSSPLRT